MGQDIPHEWNHFLFDVNILWNLGDLDLNFELRMKVERRTKPRHRLYKQVVPEPVQLWNCIEASVIIFLAGPTFEITNQCIPYAIGQNYDVMYQNNGASEGLSTHFDWRLRR
jgi:hypothetical protein